MKVVRHALRGVRDDGGTWECRRCGRSWRLGEDRPTHCVGANLKIYFDFRDWWVGYYRAELFHYVCPIPTLVFRWGRRQ